ncbi:MAG: hypothetical protein ACFFG0_14100 [Candidatus Thorarchaeota archaeon]
MKEYNGIELDEKNYAIIKSLHNKIGELHYCNYFDDLTESFNAFYAENGNILNLMLLIREDTVLQELISLNSLRILYLEGNNHTILPKSIGEVKSLENLAVHRFNLENIPKSLGTLKNLKILRFSKFSQIMFPETMNDLNSLKLFGLYECRLELLPDFLLNLISLERLELPTCQLIETSENIRIIRVLKERGVRIQDPQWIKEQ